MTGSQNSNTHGEQNMELWRKFSWGKEQQLEHTPIKTFSPSLCWILNNCPSFLFQSEHHISATTASPTTSTTTTSTTTKFCQII